MHTPRLLTSGTSSTGTLRSPPRCRLFRFFFCHHSPTFFGRHFPTLLSPPPPTPDVSAGSERLKKTHTTGELKVESMYINKVGPHSGVQPQDPVPCRGGGRSACAPVAQKPDLCGGGCCVVPSYVGIPLLVSAGQGRCPFLAQPPPRIHVQITPLLPSFHHCFPSQSLSNIELHHLVPSPRPRPPPQSLSYLEQVVVALASRSRSHTPYRQTKLTHLLKDAIGGNSKTVLLANIHTGAP
eukprot:scaffold12631_cov82-Isochrysis_galbana.AAC.1